MTTETILTSTDGAAFVITLNRQDKRNAFSKQMMQEIADACQVAEADDRVRGIIVTGGSKFFSAGADLNEAMAIKSTRDGVEYMKHWERLNNTIETLSKPVIAAIEGFCVTGGFEFVLACDIRVGARGSSFALTSSKIGTVPGAGGTQRLPRLVGVGKALDIMFSAESLDGEEAYRCGILEHLVPAGQALAHAKLMIRVYEERAPLSLAYVKRAVRAGMQMDQSSAIEFERFLVTAIYGTEDKNEGIGAFLEKRKATFKGR
jgi:enoyl-CoA hydratase/carnithine racemase